MHHILTHARQIKQDNAGRDCQDLLRMYRKEHRLTDDDETDDHAVPTFWMVQDGTRVFDFGPRQIKMVVRCRYGICFLRLYIRGAG